MISVQDILREKDRQELYSIKPDATVYEALELMARKDIGALPVMEGSKLVGMFSERDYARKVILHGRTSRDTTVGELMTSPVTTVDPAESIDTCMRLMTDHRIRHLPVVAGTTMIGIVSIGDVVKATIDDQRVAIRDLENYITGRR